MRNRRSSETALLTDKHQIILSRHPRMPQHHFLESRPNRSSSPWHTHTREGTFVSQASASACPELHQTRHSREHWLLQEHNMSAITALAINGEDDYARTSSLEKRFKYIHRILSFRWKSQYRAAFPRENARPLKGGRCRSGSRFSAQARLNLPPTDEQTNPQTNTQTWQILPIRTLPGPLLHQKMAYPPQPRDELLKQATGQGQYQKAGD